MSKLPFMQLYVSDLIGDTLHLSTEQFGAYVLLLMAMWNAGGSLPNDEAKLARVARLSVKKWRSVSDDLMAFFDRDEASIRHSKIDRRGYGVPHRIMLSAAERDEIYERDGEVCAYCRSTQGPFHIDHVIPAAMGGSNDPSNLVVACRDCNLSKGAKMLSDWRESA